MANRPGDDREPPPDHRRALRVVIAVSTGGIVLALAGPALLAPAALAKALLGGLYVAAIGLTTAMFY